MREERRRVLSLFFATERGSNLSLPIGRHSRLPIALAASLLALLVVAPFAQASKGVVSWIGSASAGAADGEFSTPRAVAVNATGAGGVAAGDIYVVDSANNRIQRFSAAGAFQSKFGSTGTGAGQLTTPTGIAVDQADGSVYVFEQGNRRVDKFSATGTFLLAFGAGVADGTTNALQTCTSTCFAGLTGTANGGFGTTTTAPSLAVVPAGAPNAGDVVVADAGNSASTGRRIEAFSVPGVSGPAVFQAKIGASGSGNGQFGTASPTRVAVDDAGRVYAVDNGNSRVQRFTYTTGPPTFTFDTIYGATQLSGAPAPTNIAIDPGAVSAGDASDDHVFATKPCNGTICPAGSFPPPFSTTEVRIKELDTAANPALIDTHMVAAGIVPVNGLGMNTANNRLFVSSTTGGHRVYVLDTVAPASAEMDPVTPVDSITAHSGTLHASVNPNGAPDVSYRFEYSLDGASWTPVSSSDTVLGSQVTPQTVSQALNPSGGGLEPNTLYHVRVVVTRPFNRTTISAEAAFTTSGAKPLVETVGSPLRTSTTVRFDARVAPLNTATTYHFEYGTQGACDSHPCESTPDASAGAGGLFRLVSEEVTGLQPGATYHYRIVADNSTPGPPSIGGDFAVTTRLSDAPLSHGHFRGPPGSDRAWEQVNTPDTSGNPLFGGLAFSNDGNRAIYQVLGGLSQGDTGSFQGIYFAERSESGWQTRSITPKRSELKGPAWIPPAGTADLSDLVSLNTEGLAGGPTATFHLHPDGPPAKVFEASDAEYQGLTLVSDDASRIVELLSGELDPAHPGTGSSSQLYDVSSGLPQLASLLPGDVVPTCNAGSGPGVIFGLPADFFNVPRRTTHWLTADGSALFFSSPGISCGGEPQLYMRVFGAQATTLISKSPVSGPACGAALIKSTTTSAFFWTQSRLAADDTEAPEGCKSDETGTARDGDVYRYSLGDGALDCVTCVISGGDANVAPGTSGYGPGVNIAVAEDGSRVYFTTASHLLSGAPPVGVRAIYRVDVASGNLAYVGPGGGDEVIGDSTAKNETLSADGTVLIFRSANAALDALTSSDNDGTSQYYRYDDRDRSLICVSCPQDGSPPVDEVKGAVGNGGTLVSLNAAGPNISPVDADGDFFFNTPTPLVSADQNTAGAEENPETGTDVYEWRDGRLLLVTDGLTSWVEHNVPDVAGVSPSGRDVYFDATAQYTPDALDGIRRLYDARVGGGIGFPPTPVPCPLEVCQGTPVGAPEEETPGTSSFIGPETGRPVVACRRGKVRRHGRCVHKPKRRHHKPTRRAANDDRRIAR